MNYPGGKGSCFRHLINLMPPHDTYIETHLGGGNVLERKRPARSRNIGVDVDDVVIARWREVGRRRPFDLELHCMDAVAFLEAFTFKGGELVYCDPPYVRSTRTRDMYAHEYSDAQHLELLSVLVTLPCFVIVSGYDSPLYRDLLQDRHGWRCELIPNTTRGGSVVERAWCNFPPAAELHDTRYVGADYRARERIKRKRNRWRAKFANMPAAERQVVLEALLELEPAKAAIAPAEGENGRAGARRSNDLHPPRYISTPLFDGADRIAAPGGIADRVGGIPPPAATVAAAVRA